MRLIKKYALLFVIMILIIIALWSLQACTSSTKTLATIVTDSTSKSTTKPVGLPDTQINQSINKEEKL